MQLRVVSLISSGSLQHSKHKVILWIVLNSVVQCICMRKYCMYNCLVCEHLLSCEHYQQHHPPFDASYNGRWVKMLLRWEQGSRVAVVMFQLFSYLRILWYSRRLRLQAITQEEHAKQSFVTSTKKLVCSQLHTLLLRVVALLLRVLACLVRGVTQPCTYATQHATPQHHATPRITTLSRIITQHCVLPRNTTQQPK
jgi:hypothetical protein